jgi:hypothetical protein
MSGISTPIVRDKFGTSSDCIHYKHAHGGRLLGYLSIGPKYAAPTAAIVVRLPILSKR